LVPAWSPFANGGTTARRGEFRTNASLRDEFYHLAGIG
jgi:hypothetical protein